jgi:hypothetical protein
MPYTVFHERMALHDPIVACCVVWSLVVMNAALDRQSPVMAFGAGTLLGLGILTKATSGFAIPWFLLVAAGLFGISGLRRRARTVAGYAAAVALPVGAIAFALLRWGPLEGATPLLLRTERVGVWAGFWANLGNVPSWVASFNSVPFAILAAVALVYGVTKPSWLKIGLAVCFLTSTAAHALLFKHWFSRYLLFMLVPLVAMIGIAISESAAAAATAYGRRSWRLADWWAQGILTALCLLLAFSAPHWLAQDRAFLRQPMAARVPDFDRLQYFDAWPSGEGIETVAAYMNRQVREKGPALLVVGGWGNHGLWSMPLVAKLDSRLVVRSQDIYSRELLASVATEAKQQPTFLLFEPPRYPRPDQFLSLAYPQPRLVFEWKRPRSEGGYQLYALEPRTAVVSSADEARRLEAGEPIVVAVRNPNGLESVERQPFFWLGGPITVIEIASQASGTAELSATFVPGPSVPGPLRHVTITGEHGFATKEEIGAGTKVLRVPVRAGANSITLSCVERATIPRQPNGDTRPLVLGVRGLHGLRVTAASLLPAPSTP